MLKDCINNFNRGQEERKASTVQYNLDRGGRRSTGCV